DGVLPRHLFAVGRLEHVIADVDHHVVDAHALGSDMVQQRSSEGAVAALTVERDIAGWVEKGVLVGRIADDERHALLGGRRSVRAGEHESRSETRGEILENGGLHRLTTLALPNQGESAFALSESPMNPG